MDEMIKKAMEALQGSSCNEIELTDITGLKVRVVKISPAIWYNYPSPWPYQYTSQYTSQYPYQPFNSSGRV